jgi:Cu+-exporting ATPase
MHPEVSGTAPGKCPKCGMKLVQRAPAQKTGAVAAAKAYSCPMHPEVMADKTGKCPKCGMRLERR